MVRVINSEPVPKELTEEANIALGLLGVVIADHPEKMRKLLRQFGIETRDKPTAKELTAKVLYGIEKRGEKFNLALAKIIAGKLPKPDNYDSFNTGDAAGAVDGANITVGSDPVSAIAGAIGSIASIFGNIQRKKQMKQEASSKTLSTMLAYKAQQEQIVADKAAQQRTEANKMAWLKGVGILVTVGLVGWVLVKQANKKPQLQPAMT